MFLDKVTIKRIFVDMSAPIVIELMEISRFCSITLGMIGFIVIINWLRDFCAFTIKVVLPGQLGKEMASIWCHSVKAVYMIFGLLLTFIIAFGEPKESQSALLMGLHAALALSIVNLIEELN